MDTIFEQFAKKDDVDIDFNSQFCEILELQILTLDYIYPKIHKYFDKLVLACQELLTYDPLGTAVYDDDQAEMDIEDDYYVEDTGDSSWRVRRCVTFLIQTMLRQSTKQYKQIVHAFFGDDDSGSSIFARLSEKNDEIKHSLLQLLVTFI